MKHKVSVSSIERGEEGRPSCKKLTPSSPTSDNRASVLPNYPSYLAASRRMEVELGYLKVRRVKKNDQTTAQTTTNERKKEKGCTDRDTLELARAPPTA